MQAREKRAEHRLSRRRKFDQVKTNRAPDTYYVRAIEHRGEIRLKAFPKRK